MTWHVVHVGRADKSEGLKLITFPFLSGYSSVELWQASPC